MARLTLLVAGGTDAERSALVEELFDKLNIMSRTDDRGPRIWASADDPDRLPFSDHSSWN